MDLIAFIRRHRIALPDWMQDWLGLLVPSLQIIAILVAAWLLNRLLGRVLARAAHHYGVPDKWVVPLRGVGRWLIILAALLLVLERLGVSASVLWTAITGFAAVGAVAFFAAWSVLSNLFCALLIMVAQPFRPGDDIEVLDSAEKPGAKGRVVDINLLYTTLLESREPRRLLQIPNALIFQRVVRRWPGGAPEQEPVVATPVDSSSSAGL